MRGVLGDINSLYISDENEHAGGNTSRNTIRVEMTRDGDKNSATDICPDH